MICYMRIHQQLNHHHHILSINRIQHQYIDHRSTIYQSIINNSIITNSINNNSFITIIINRINRSSPSINRIFINWSSTYRSSTYRSSSIDHYHEQHISIIITSIHECVCVCVRWDDDEWLVINRIWCGYRWSIIYWNHIVGSVYGLSLIIR